MYFDFVINYRPLNFLTIFLTFLDLKKNSFQWNLDSCFNVETLFKMATREFNPVNSIYLPGTITFSHLAVKKWSLAWATREQWRQFSTPFPRHIVRQFQSLYTPSPRGLIATPYSTSVSVSLYAITARSITNQRTSSGVGIGFTFLPHVIIPDKDMEFTDSTMSGLHA
jgi:hypothetical protein